MEKKNSGRQLIKVLSSNFIGAFGSSMFTYGIGLLILRETGSSLGYGLTVVVGPVLSLILTPVIGHAVDRFDRKKIVLYAQLLSMATLMLFSALSAQGFLNLFTVILPLLILLNIGDKFLQTSYSSSLSSFVYESEIQKLSSYMQSVSAVSVILAPIVGSLLYTWIPFPLFILTVVLCEAFTLLLNQTIDFHFSKPIEQTTSEPEKDGIWKSFTEGVQYLKKEPRLMSVIGIAVILNFFISIFTVGTPYVVVQLFQATNFEYSLVQVGATIGMLVTGLLLGLKEEKETDNPLRQFVRICIGMGLLVALMSVPFYFSVHQTTSIYFYFVVHIAFGVLAALVNVPMSVFLHKHIQENYKGRVFSVFQSAVQAFVPLGVLFFSFLFDWASPGIIYFSAGLMVVLIYSMLSVRFASKQRSSLVERKNKASKVSASAEQP